MIYPGPLTRLQQERSQRNYNIFNVINGLSYMCLGETVLILFAVQLACPDYVVSTLGAMTFFGFLLLPLGKIATAHFGAARSQAVFWVARNLSALLVGSATLLYCARLSGAAVGVLLFGAFLFYGFRAAGVVMSQPLIGDITTDLNRARVIAVSVGLFYISCLAALLTISYLLSLNQSLWMLTAIIVAGSLLGCTSSRYLARIDETEEIRASARRPILPELRDALKNPDLRRQLASGFSVNLGIIMMIPVSMLALKRGYAVSDTAALLFAVGQFGASAIMSFVAGKIAAAIGPRKTMLYAYAALLAIGLLWLVAPAQLHRGYMMIPFLLAGSSMVSLNNSVTHYFLQVIPPKNRVAASIFISVATGAGAGIAGMLLAGALLELCARYSETPLGGYRLYFLAALLLLLPGLRIIARLTPLPIEKRKIRKSWQDAI